MFTKTTLVSLLAISLIGLTGLGYATFTATVNTSANASAGTLYLGTSGWTGGTTTPIGAGTCSWSNSQNGSPTSPATVTLTVTNMAPGDSCTASLTIDNLGSLPMTSESSSFSAGGGYFCTNGGYQTNCFYAVDSLANPLNSYWGTSGSQSSTVAAGGVFTPYSITVYYASGSTDQGESASFTLSFTGSVGS